MTNTISTVFFFFKYIQVKNEAKSSLFTSICHTLFKCKDGFNMPKPNLLLSIIGGAEDFVMDDSEKTEIQFAIKKLARDTDTLLTANGLNRGVSSIVAGDLLEIDSKRNNLTLLAIAPLQYGQAEAQCEVMKRFSTISRIASNVCHSFDDFVSAQ
jgi:SLOG in TRPM